MLCHNNRPSAEICNNTVVFCFYWGETTWKKRSLGYCVGSAALKTTVFLSAPAVLMTDNGNMIVIIPGSSLSFENPWTIRPVFYIILMYFSVSFFFFFFYCISQTTIWPVSDPPWVALLLPGKRTAQEFIYLSCFLHIALALLSKTRAISPAACVQVMKIWMWFSLFVFSLPILSGPWLKISNLYVLFTSCCFLVTFSFHRWRVFLHLKIFICI